MAKTKELKRADGLMQRYKMAKRKKKKTADDYLKETPSHIKKSSAFERGYVIGQIKGVEIYYDKLRKSQNRITRSRKSKKLRM